MISNFLVACRGCREGIRLRISIGYEERQNFYALCPNCQAVLHGSLLTDQAKGRLLDLTIDGKPAEPVDSAEFTVNVCNDLPVDPRPTSMKQPDGSPFLMHFERLGNPFIAWEGFVGRFHEAIDHDWSEMKRWYGYYVRRDWQRFDEHARRLINDDWPDDPGMLARHDIIHRALDLLFLPLFPRGDYVSWRVELSPRDDNSSNWPKVISFISEWEANTDTGQLQHDLFDVLDQFVVLRWTLLPNMLLDLYEANTVDFDPHWRVMRNDFRELRDLHNRLFETCYVVLPVVMAFVNTLVRGQPKSFPDGSSHSLQKVSSMTAAKKGDLLKQYSSWGGEITELLDRHLRNAVGHADARHDLVTGQIVSPRSAMSYIDFANRTGRGIQVVLLCMSTIKLLLICHDSSSG